jgi:uncharacterized protein YcfL
MDSIILDTIAFIRQVTEDTQGQVKLQGEVIHFTIDAREPKGVAHVNIAARMTNIQLFDDGTRGDTVKDDGVYELDFWIPPGLEKNNAVISGFFTDRVGNQAERVDAVGTVTIQDPPTKVTLLEPSPLETSATSLELAWTMNNDSDFNSYKLYRSNFAGVNLGSTLVTTITNRSALTYVDSSLQEKTTFYYKLYVFDTFGLSTPSNEVKVTTRANQPPLPVTLTQPTQIDSATLRLSWTQSTEVDFASYRVYRSELSPVDTTEAPIGIINNDPLITFYDDTGLQNNIQYFYRVFVFDKGGLSAGSNEVRGKLNN